MQHNLKMWPEFFDDVASGRKPFEYRRDDRNYQIGDTLHIEEFQPMLGSYTGRSCDVDVTYVQRQTRNMEKIGLPEGFCILAIANPAYQRRDGYSNTVPSKAVTLMVPSGYESGEAFAKDCGFELAEPSKAERKLWLCDSCEKPFLVNLNITPNFCPYCRETKLTESTK